MRSNMQILLEGRGPITLRMNDHVATGGEGSIFRVSDMAIKIYLDSAQMKQRSVPDKIKRLSKLFSSYPYIVAPEGIVTTPAGDPIGHYLPYVQDPPLGHPMARVFTNDFYQREGFNEKLASVLVGRMRETVMFAHGSGALLIDPNEMNWFALAVNKDPEPRIIDVDSWIIGLMPPTVSVMPSIRDWHTKNLGKQSDWFAWGIVTFQVYTGIHPYKGTLQGYARSDMERRMKENASVFSPGVQLNRAVRDFNCIPGPLRDWYEATFQLGERNEPPSPFDTGISTPKAASVLRVTATGQVGTLVFEKLFGTSGDPVVRIFHCGVARLASGKLIDLNTGRQIIAVSSPTCEVVKVEQGWLVGELNGTFIYINERDLRFETLQFQMVAHGLVGYENRMFFVGDNGLTEVKSNFFGSKLIVSAGQTWGIIVKSTKWFQGVGVLDSMGAKFVVVPFGESAVAQTRVREIDNLQVVAAKAGSRFVSIVGLQKNGDYAKVELAFDRDYRSYRSWVGITDGPELNLAILPRGVCATIIRDGELDVFVPSNGNTTKLGESRIATDMMLANWYDQVVYTQNGETWSLRMR